jgi:hypothetical protein
MSGTVYKLPNSGQDCHIKIITFLMGKGKNLLAPHEYIIHIVGWRKKGSVSGVFF